MSGEARLWMPGVLKVTSMAHFYLPGLLIRLRATSALTKQLAELAYFYVGRPLAVCSFYATRSCHFNWHGKCRWPGASWIVLTREWCRIHCTALMKALDIERRISHSDFMRVYTVDDADCPVRLRLKIFPVLCHRGFPNTWLGILCLGNVSYCCIETKNELFVYFCSRASICLLTTALSEWAAHRHPCPSQCTAIRDSVKTPEPQRKQYD